MFIESNCIVIFSFKVDFKDLFLLFPFPILMEILFPGHQLVAVGLRVQGKVLLLLLSLFAKML